MQKESKQTDFISKPQDQVHAQKDNEKEQILDEKEKYERNITAVPITAAPAENKSKVKLQKALKEIHKAALA